MAEGATNTSAPQTILRWLTQHKLRVLWKREGNTTLHCRSTFCSSWLGTPSRNTQTHQSLHTSNHILRALQGHTWQQEFGREIKAATDVSTQQAYRSWAKGRGQPKKTHVYLVADWWTISFQKRNRKKTPTGLDLLPLTSAKRFWYPWSVGS